MSPVGASIYCSLRHPAALQIDPPTGDGDLPLGITRTKDFSRQIQHHFTHRRRINYPITVCPSGTDDFAPMKASGLNAGQFPHLKTG
jgi:hypothetical protein